MSNIERWDSARLGPMCLAAIEALYQPSSRYSVRYNRYSPGDSFSVICWASRMYVLAGACRVTYAAEELELHSGDVADIRAGEHDFCTLYDDSVEVVNVWELPAEFWANDGTRDRME